MVSATLDSLAERAPTTNVDAIAMEFGLAEFRVGSAGYHWTLQWLRFRPMFPRVFVRADVDGAFVALVTGSGSAAVVAYKPGFQAEVVYDVPDVRRALSHALDLLATDVVIGEATR